MAQDSHLRDIHFYAGPLMCVCVLFTKHEHLFMIGELDVYNTSS